VATSTAALLESPEPTGTDDTIPASNPFTGSKNTIKEREQNRDDSLSVKYHGNRQ